MRNPIDRLATPLRKVLKFWVSRVRHRWLSRPPARRLGRPPGPLRRAIQLEFHWNSKG
jgi:hypothetical protein